MPVSEQWGVLVRKDSAFAGKSCVHPEDLRGTPLIMARRKTVKNELINWFGDAFSTMETAAAYNLITNAVAMVESGVGAAICCDLGHRYSGLTFIPLEPKLEAGSVLVWKRHQELPWATLRFIDHVKEQIQMQSR